MKIFRLLLPVVLTCCALAAVPVLDASAEECVDYSGSSVLFKGYSISDVNIFHAIASREGWAFFCIKPEGGVSGSLPYFRSYELGSSIFNPPLFEDTVYLTTSASRIILLTDHAVLAMGSAGLGVIDISNPELLGDVSLTPTGDICRDVARLGSDHVVTAEWSALRIYDLQDPANPSETGAVTLTYARTVAVSGDLAFVACGNLGLAIIDIGNPAVPVFLGQIPVGGFVDSVAAEKDRVYLTGYLIGLVTVDVGTPSAPFVVDTMPLIGQPETIAVKDGYAYITVGEAITVIPELPDFDALALVRLNRPTAPAVVDYFFPQMDYTCLALGMDRIFLGDSANSQYEYIMAPFQCPDVSDVPEPAAADLSLSSPWPNPFNPSVNIGFSLPRDEPGRIGVYDLRGNLVAEVWRGTGTGDEMTATWNGTDTTGRACPSGNYGFILSHSGSGQSTRVTGTLLR